MPTIDCRDGEGGLFTCYDVQTEIQLDKRLEWTIHHCGKSSSGAGAEGTIYMRVGGSAAPAATYADGKGKYPVESGKSYPIRKGAESVFLICASGQQASFIIVSGARVAGSPAY